MAGLGGYLDGLRCPQGTSPSHTAIGGGGGGSFDVPQPNYREFLDRYISALDDGQRPSLTEQPCLYFPFVADLDLEYDVPGVDPEDASGSDASASGLARVHGDDFVFEVASSFAETVVRMGASPMAAHSVEVFVMQRSAPYVKSHGKVRDGIHVMLPKCIMTRPAQYIVRKRSLSKIANALANLPGQSNDAEKCVDKCYSENGTNWQMYGSSKPGRDPYLISHVMRLVINQGECVSRCSEVINNACDWSRWVPALSVRCGGPDSAWPLSHDASQEADEIEEAWSERKFAALQTRGGFLLQDSGGDCTSEGPASSSDYCTADDVSRAREVMRCMSVKRADTYETWRNVGFALRNTSAELVDAWHEFSSKSPKYDRRVCQMFWDRLRPEQRQGPKLTLGSLVKWAQEDDPPALQSIERDEIEQLLVDAIHGNTHTDWGKYVCALNPKSLASVRAQGSGRGDRVLYVFEGHRWRPEPCGTFVKVMLKKQIVDEVANYAARFPDDVELAKSASKAITSLKTKGFRENVLGDVTENVGDDLLLEKLDSKRHLVGWENGVFDLEAQKFRDGRAEDYITMSTHHDYLPPDAQKFYRTAREVQSFLEKVHVCPVLRKYCLDSLAVMLSGTISFEHMHCWTGTGSNGKSRTIKLLDEGMGDYLKTLPPSLLTGVRPESGKPTPELCSAAGARVVVMTEVDGKATINVAVMKELSGGDKIAVRALYGGASTMKPQFTMIMTCNDLSKVDANDDGTWRRLKVLPYRSKFVLENPREELNEFKADNAMDGRIETWAPYFISMLQSRYPAALEDMRSEPPAITEQVRQYRVASDRDADFVNQNIILNVPRGDDDDEWEDADAWVLLDMYKREGRDRDITLSKLSEKLQRFEIPAPTIDAATGTATIPGYRIALRSRT
jgi:phage/plasmid-associated DNA primase